MKPGNSTSRLKGVTTLVAVMSLALLALSAGTASASWLDPTFLSAAGQDANDPHVAMDLDGDALFVWSRVDGSFNRIEVRPRTAAGVLGPVSPPLSAAGQHATQPRVAVDEDGDALIVWVRSNGTNLIIQARSRSKTGVFGPVVNLSATGQDAQEPRVAIDDDGDAIVTWYRFDGANYRAQARVRSAAGAWGTTTTLSPAGTSAFSPRVAVDDTGDGIVTWYNFDGTKQHVVYRYRPVGGSFGATVPVSQADHDGALPAVDMDQNGDAVIAWQDQDLSGLQRILARPVTTSGTLGPIQTLSSVTANAAEVAMSPGGRATVVWQRDVGAGIFIEGRVRSGGTWGPAKVLSDTPNDAFEPHVAAGTTGSTAVWRRQDADANWRVESRPWLPSSWRPFTVLSPDDRDSLFQQVAMEEVGGEAIVVWRSTDGANFRIEWSAGQ